MDWHIVFLVVFFITMFDVCHVHKLSVNRYVNFTSGFIYLWSVHEWKHSLHVIWIGRSVVWYKAPWLCSGIDNRSLLRVKWRIVMQSVPSLKIRYIGFLCCPQMVLCAPDYGAVTRLSYWEVDLFVSDYHTQQIRESST